MPPGILLDENTKYEIFTDFLKEKHPNLLEYFNNLILEKTIFEIEQLEIEDTKCYHTGGMNIINPISESYYIFLHKCESDIIELTSLAHEYGHTIDYLNLTSHVTKKDFSYYPFKSIFIETISSLYEKEFLDFAIRNHLDTKHAKSQLQNYYINIIFHFNEMNLLCNLPESILKHDKYKNMPKEKLYSIARSSCDVLTDYEDFPEPSELNLFYNLEYGYGKLLATYFSYLEKNDKDKFYDSINAFLEMRSGYFPKDFYQRLGTNLVELSKIVKEEINSSDVKIKIK